VICGVPSSWKPGAISGNYGSYTWSPSGQFFAAQTPTSVEIWDPLTLDKHSTLQPTKPMLKDLKPIGHSPGALAYSPDGHSLVGFFGSVAIIWDIQTGGMIKEIDCRAANASPKSFVWSLDGTRIGAIFPAGVGNWFMVTCDITSVKISTHIVQSPFEPHLWSRGNSIWMMVISEDKITINTFEIQPTTTVYLVESYSIDCDISDDPPPVMHWGGLVFGSFHNGELHIYNIRSKRFMSSECGFITANCFSPDGDLLAVSSRHEVRIWRLETDRAEYYLWKTFPLWEALGDTPRSFKFSPTSSSLLISRDGYLEVQHLEGSITRTPEKKSLIEFSTNGTYVVTAFKDKPTIIITSLYKNNSWLIDTNFAIRQLLLASNILIVGGLSGVRATLHPKLYCAKGGVNRRTNQSGDKPQPQQLLVVASSGRCSCCTTGLTR